MEELQMFNFKHFIIGLVLAVLMLGATATRSEVNNTAILFCASMAEIGEEMQLERQLGHSITEVMIKWVEDERLSSPKLINFLVQEAFRYPILEEQEDKIEVAIRFGAEVYGSCIEDIINSSVLKAPLPEEAI